MLLLVEIKEHRKELCMDWGLYIASIIGLLTGLLSWLHPNILPFFTVKSQNLIGVLLSYASISFGASIAGAGFSLALPGSDRIKRWSQMPNNPFDFLIFVFSWSAVAQICLIIFSVLFLFFQFDESINKCPLTLGIGTFILVYSIAELFEVVVAIIQLGYTISQEEASQNVASKNNRMTEQEQQTIRNAKRDDIPSTSRSENSVKMLRIASISARLTFLTAALALYCFITTGEQSSNSCMLLSPTAWTIYFTFLTIIFFTTSLLSKYSK